MQILGSLTHKGLAGMYIRMDVYIFMLSRGGGGGAIFLLSPLHIHIHMCDEKLFPVNA